MRQNSSRLAAAAQGLLRPQAGLLLLGCIGALWLAAGATGLGILASYATSSPPTPSAPLRWPSESQLPSPTNSARVVMFIHPHCPCSSASINELNRLISRTTGRAEFLIAVYAPSSESAQWATTSLTINAESLAGVQVVQDIDGHEAALFGATTSGHVVVYAVDQTLLFHGGITPSRGHEGDNLGESSIIAALSGAAPAATTTPTYGCDLSNPQEPACSHCAEEIKP